MMEECGGCTSGMLFLNQGGGWKDGVLGFKLYCFVYLPSVV